MNFNEQLKFGNPVAATTVFGFVTGLLIFIMLADFSYTLKVFVGTLLFFLIIAHSSLFLIRRKRGKEKFVETLEELKKRNRKFENQSRALQNILSDFNQEKLELKLENHRREKAEELIRVILDNTVDCIVTIDYFGTIVSVNKATQHLFGYEEQELLGKNVKILVPSPHKEKHDVYIDNYKKTGVGKIIGSGREVEGLCKNGDQIPIELSISEVKFGRETFFTGIMRDISERKRTEGELKNALSQAQSASMAKSDFLSNMSHEIRTPLNTVLGLAEVLLDTHLTEEQRRYLKTLKDSGDTLLNIINDILDLSKIEAGQLKTECVEFDLEELMDQISTMMSVKAHEKSLDIILDLDSTVPTLLFGDPLRLRQIVYNLIGNAIKFTEKGFVKLNISLVKRCESVCLVEFVVEDTGIGIPKDRTKEIFKSFTQADSSTTRRFGGTGLGLNIVDKLVKKMGGQIKVESELDKGSKFSFTLPFQFSKSWQLNQSSLDHILVDKSFLVIDPVLENRKILTKILRSWGASVQVASNGLEALEKLQNKQAFHFDLVFVDCRLRDMGGLDLVEQLKNENIFPTSLIVMVYTSKHRSADMKKMKDLGVNSYVIKPFHKNELQNVIRRVLARPTHGNLLVVDDDFDILESMKSLFEPLDVHVKIAMNCKEALKMINDQHVDTVLCDYKLTRENGLTLLEKLRKSGNDLPFIFHSGYLDKEIMSKAIDLKADAFLGKGSDPKQLLELVSTSIEKGIALRKSKIKKEEKPIVDNRRLKILLAEDSIKNQQLIKIYLKDTNYSLETALNGIEACDKFKNSRYDLVLMDMQMPDMDGYTATKKIREYEEEHQSKNTPIVALTAFALQGEKEKSLNAGCNDHLTKPISRTVLLDSIMENTRKVA